VKWGLQPIVTRSYNSLKQSDYATGFIPDITAKEGLKLYPYGDPRDPLLGAALAQITGSPVVRAPNTSLRTTSYEEFRSTIEKKAGGSNMFFDK
jgi:carboxyl-terminal processing protease